MPSPNTIIAILKASKHIPPEILEKVERLASVTPSTQFLDKLISCDILHPVMVENLYGFVKFLEDDFPIDGAVEGTVYALSGEKKKDILFARQVLNEGLCTLKKINECFREQGELEKKSGKVLLLSQIMVRHHLIPVDRFVRFHREIERKLKTESLNDLLSDDESFRIFIKNNTIQFSEASIPENFGAYHIIEEIARGGMGVVYKAYDSKLKRHIALKVLKAWDNPPLEEIQRFHREARLAASLNHQNIVNIYDAGVVDGVHYFTMDYVEGETLSQRLARDSIPPTEALIIAREIALALGYAHSQGIIHRDVKPGNIILDVSARPLLTDFGLAKGTNTGESHLTKSGAALGTPAYMSPEQAQGRKINKKSDIYSLGAVLYEMLTGQPPFSGDAVGVVISDVISKDPVFPSKLNPSLHADIESICLKSMAKDQEQRYQKAKDMADDIDRFLKGDKIGISRSTHLTRRIVQKISKRISDLIPTTIILGICIIVAGWLFLERSLQITGAKNLYLQGKVLLQEKHDYPPAVSKLRKASKYYDKAKELLQETADSHIDRAIKLLKSCKINQKLFAEQYEKGMIRFRKSSTTEDRWRNLKHLEKLKEFQNKNQKDYLQAVHDFRQALVCVPYDANARKHLGEIYLQKLVASENENNRKISKWWEQAMQFYLAASEYPAQGFLSVRSSPVKTQTVIYVFALEEHYMKLVPIGWRMREISGSHDFSGYLEKNYLQNNEPRLDVNSSVGNSPIERASLPVGNYLVVLSAKNHFEARFIVMIDRGGEKCLDVSLPRFSPLLENFSYIPCGWRKEVDLENYYFLAKSELTWKEYSRFLENTGRSKYRFRNLKNDQPVVGVSWQDAQDYCHWLTRKHKGKIRYALPSLDIWQYAAGAQDGRLYPWGNYFERCFIDDETEAFDVSPYGIFQMAGGVREWCDGGRPLVCAGSFRQQNPLYFRIYYNSSYSKNFKDSDIGFRLMAKIRR